MTMFTMELLMVTVIGAAVVVTTLGEIRNLVGEPDYRQVRLHWEAETEPITSYQVRYCELQTWGAQRCRTQEVTEPKGNDIEDNVRFYATDIRSLRMATTYSFEIKKRRENGEREDRAEGDGHTQNIIVIPTKGFSAKATQCLPHASEIEVSTGPYFGGRIAVEATDGERCALDGEPNSPRDTYTLRINHTECGSRVNETTVATFVLVQENLPILTHSTRRFLVLCSYQPETLTVRAGISLPGSGYSGQGQVHMDVTADQDDNYLGTRRGRSFRTSRVLQKPEALVKEESLTDASSSTTTGSNVVPVIVIAMLSLAGVIGLVAIILKIANKRVLQDFDNVSTTSEISTSSCGTAMEPHGTSENSSRSNTVNI